VLLEYKPGGGSTIAADFTAKSPPDGYTIVLLLTAHGINATLMQKLPYIHPVHATWVRIECLSWIH